MSYNCHIMLLGTLRNNTEVLVVATCQIKHLCTWALDLYVKSVCVCVFFTPIGTVCVT